MKKTNMIKVTKDTYLNLDRISTVAIADIPAKCFTIQYDNGTSMRCSVPFEDATKEFIDIFYPSSEEKKKLSDVKKKAD